MRNVTHEVEVEVCNEVNKAYNLSLHTHLYTTIIQDREDYLIIRI